MSNFDKPMATDKAREDLQKDLANPKPGYWNKLRATMQHVGMKCKMMCGGGGTATGGCGKAPVADTNCPYTDDIDES